MKKIGNMLWSAGGAVGIAWLAYQSFADQLDRFDRIIVGAVLLTVSLTMTVRAVEKYSEQ